MIRITARLPALLACIVVTGYPPAIAIAADDMTAGSSAEIPRKKALSQTQRSQLAGLHSAEAFAGEFSGFESQLRELAALARRNPRDARALEASLAMTRSSLSRVAGHAASLESGFREAGNYESAKQGSRLIDEVRSALDSISKQLDSDQALTQMKLQQLMAQLSGLETMVANVFKKADDTKQAIVQNLKP